MFGIMKAWNWKHIPVAVYMSIQNIQIQYQLIVNYMLYNVVLYAMNLSAWSSILGLWNHALVDTVCNQADPIQHNNMCFQLEFVSRYWQGQTVERREQLTVVPYIQPLACPFVGSEPSSPLPSHEILRWSNAVAARGMEKLPLHELCEYKKSLRWTSLIRWTSLNFIDFAHRSSSPQMFRPPGSGNPLIFSSLACEPQNRFAINLGYLWNWSRQIEMPGKTVWSEGCQPSKYNHRSTESGDISCLKILPGTLSQSLVHFHNVCADNPTKMFDPWHTSLCGLHYYCLHIVVLLAVHITIYHINRTLPLKSCMPLLKSIFKKTWKENACRQRHKFGMVWPLFIICNTLYLLIKLLFICTHSWYTFECRRTALQKVWCWECVSTCW